MRKKVITFIRHAESENNALFDKKTERYLELRKAEPFLTTTGESQALLLKQYFRKNKAAYDFDLVLSSPMKRAMQTAKILFEGSSAIKKVSDLIFESRGPYELEKPVPGLSAAEFKKDYPDFQLPFAVSDNGWYHEDEIEDIYEAFMRAKRLMRAIEIEIKQSRIAIVTHGRFLSFIFTILMKEYLMKEFNFGIPTMPELTSLTNLIYTQKTYIIQDFAITPHVDLNNS